jgi:hypothetical protein
MRLESGETMFCLIFELLLLKKEVEEVKDDIQKQRCTTKNPGNKVCTLNCIVGRGSCWGRGPDQSSDPWIYLLLLAFPVNISYFLFRLVKTVFAEPYTVVASGKQDFCACSNLQEQ